ncbi:lipocalin family protein [Paucihalobacter sp.]|uniref:lipocalin family protein n=1 Tax=Paucihalobacter sp. TaxID=2850405 RepID=UPI003D160BCA
MRWFLISIESVNPSNTNINVFDECQKNSYFDLGVNNLLVFQTFDGDPCVSQEFQAYEYNLTTDNSQIVLNNEPAVVLWDIIEITNTSLELIADNGSTFNLMR